MSALAGIFKFDRRESVRKSELMELAGGIDRVGPDGGGEHLSSNLGMAYRAFYTTPESRFERPPLVREGCIITWDGRLDNREDVRERVSRKYEDTPTDLDLVFAAYKEWGTSCFQELIGDWAIALWDQVKEQLILARDYIGVRRLFYRLDEGGVAWCTTLEPLVLTSPRKLHLDLDYIAGCFYPRPPVETSPYREIRSVIPASFLMFHYGGKHSIKQYWSLNPYARIHYATDSEYEAHFREVFRASVNRRLRADRTVLAELSGGLDSSSIVCMADDIRSHHPGAAIETLSYYDTDEPSGDERPYFTLVERTRERKGHHISTSDFRRQTAHEALAPLPADHFSAVPGYFAPSLRWASMIADIQNRAGARVTLSGVGGDELLGGVQYEAPELADHLLAGRLWSFSRSLYGWSLARRKTIFQLLFESLQLLRASNNPRSLVVRPDHPLTWSNLKPPTQHAALLSFTHWRRLTPSKLSMEWARYCLAQQLTAIDPPFVSCMERRYPYLDRSLFVFLASIPRAQVIQAGKRRHLMRRALRGIVPIDVLLRKTKWFGFRRSVATLRDQRQMIESMFSQAWISDKEFLDKNIVWSHLEAIEQSADSEGPTLIAAIGLEHWLRSQLVKGVFDICSMPSQLRSGAHQPKIAVSIMPR